MSITISGDGSITGLVSGGLPDGSVTAADLADTYLTPTGDGSGLTGIASSSGNYELLYDSALPAVNTLTISNVPSWATKLEISIVNIDTGASNDILYMRLLKGGTNQISSLYEHWTKQIGGSSVSTNSKFTDRFQLSHATATPKAGNVTLLQTDSRGWSLAGQVIDVTGDTLAVSTGYCGDTSVITGLHIWTSGGAAFTTGAISIYAAGEA